MKKKIIAITLATAMCLASLVGCGDKSTPANDGDSAEVSADTDAPEQTDTPEDDSAPEEEEQQASSVSSLPHYDCKQEVLDADPGDGLVQIADMVFRIQYAMNLDDVRAVVEASDTGLVCVDTKDNEGNDIVEIHDQNGNKAIGLTWSYCTGNEDFPFSEPGMYLFTVTPVKYERDWVDYNSQYLAGGIPYNHLGYDDSVDLTSFTYTKEELIEKLRSEGFVSEEELEERTPFSKFYTEPNGLSLAVSYPTNLWKDSCTYTEDFIVYTYGWKMKEPTALVSVEIACSNYINTDKYNEIMYGETF